MKLTKERTEYIIVKATCKDEYQECDFAILKINEDFLWECLEKIVSIHDKDNYTEYYSTYCPFYCSFYIENEGEGEIFDFLKSELIWSYIELDDLEISLFTDIEDRVTQEELKIYADGEFYIQGEGKWTEVTFLTSHINIHSL